MNLEFIKPQNLGSLLMKSTQSNFNLRLPGSYLVRSYLITTVSKECLLAKEVFTPIFNGLSSILDCVDGVTPLAFAAAFAFFLWRTDSFFVALDFAGSLAGSSGWINQTPSTSLWIGTVTFIFSIWLIVLAHTVSSTFDRIAKYSAGTMSIHRAGSNSFFAYSKACLVAMLGRP